MRVPRFREPHDGHETRENTLDPFASSHIVAENLFAPTQGLLKLQAFFISNIRSASVSQVGRNPPL